MDLAVKVRCNTIAAYAVSSPGRKGENQMRLRKLLTLSLVLTFVVCSLSLASYAKKGPPCKPNLKACPPEGCGTAFDAKLNVRKNIRIEDNQTATVRSLTSIKKLDDPEDFSQGDDRDELTALGEGQKITVLAFLLVAKPELSGESCNCNLHTREETDNHLVLVSKFTVDKFPVAKTAAANKAVFTSREQESVTAEFTPRVRLDHPNFTREKVQPLIAKRPKKALLVRVTGLLLFDSEHFIRNPLVRKTNWEIHPVFKLEFCETDNCTVGSNAGWKSLDDQP
jgi:hypothetical protein